MSEPKTHNRIYLDYAAATPLSLQAAAAMAEVQGVFGNPSSLHLRGREARAILDNARGRVAAVLGASPQEIIFTGSGSEANALAILGATRAANLVRGSSVAPKGHVLVSAVEHKSVLLCADALRREGYDVTILPVDHEGLVSPATFIQALRPDTILVSIMYANNEIGTIEPVKELARVVADARADGIYPLFHTDACQAPPYLPIDVKGLGIDLMTINSSKVYGPKGIGALSVRDGVNLVPVIPGEQWEGRRGGTESVALAAGFAAALEEAASLREAESTRLRALQETFLERIARLIPHAIVNGPRGDRRLPNNVHVTIPGIEGESILLLLDEVGISASTGSACNSLDLEPSHVLLAIGQNPAIAHGSVRLSMGRETTEGDVCEVSKALAHIAGKLGGISALTARASLISV